MKKLLPALLVLLVLQYCSPKKETSEATDVKISLAQWSLHKSFQDGSRQAEDFASIAKNEFGLQAVEYVNSFYKEQATDRAFWQRMRAKADSLEVKSLLIMVDGEGDLGSSDSLERKTAVENHFKWVDAASILGCHSIRVNAFGKGIKEEVQAAMIDALKQLCTYAAKANINIIIENHGLYSSDGKWVAEIIRQVNMPNAGTLPDFGNWCTAYQWGSTDGSRTCTEEYDRYQGVGEMMPFAKGVSAKSYSFNEQGDEPTIDYVRMLKVVNDAGFDGYIGIEYEGSELSEPDGIRATKVLLEKVWNQK